MTPDASKHNPDPQYIRDLIGQSGLTQVEAAALIGINARQMRRHCAPVDVATHAPAPYLVQFALECLAGNCNSPRNS